MAPASLQYRAPPNLQMYRADAGSGQGYTTPLLFSVEEALFASTRDAVLLVNLDMLIVFANTHAKRLFGYSAAELIAGPFQLLVAERFRTLYGHFWQRQTVGCRAAETETTFELLAQHKDGTTFPVEIRVSLVKHDRGVFLLHVIRDLRQRNEVLEELRQAQKMEVIGRLAGGVAHDFNNVLTVMNGYSEILASRTDIDARVRSMAKEIRSAGERGASITGQLLAFSRRQPVDAQVVNLNESIAHIEKMLRLLIGEKITLAIEPSDDLGRVLADPGQIDQVLLNLVVNARDAMPQGGQLSISTANRDVQDDLGTDMPPGHYVQLTVADTGCGMDTQTKARIFEPLFTTKKPGQGTGLGLSIVHQVIMQSDGHIAVTTEPGRGSTFRLCFPRVDSPSMVSKPRRQKPIPRGHELVLIVEDDAAVRTVMQSSLQEYGYKVLGASDPEAAIALFRDNQIPLVIMDVVLPQMSGPKLAERFKRECPNVKVLYTSGYTDETDLSELKPGDPLLLKPFTPSLLALRIRELLDEPFVPQAISNLSRTEPPRTMRRPGSSG